MTARSAPSKGWRQALSELSQKASPNGPVWPAAWDEQALDDSGLSALDAACDLAEELPYDELARMIVRRGGRFGPRAGLDARGRLPFEAAALLDSPELIQWLATRGDDMEARDARGYTPLLLACVTGSRKAALALQEFGADPHAASASSAPGLGEAAGAGLSALGLCVLAGNERAVAFCLEHRFHARHELDDGGEGLGHQVVRLRGGDRPAQVEACLRMIRSEAEAAELRRAADDATPAPRRPTL